MALPPKPNSYFFGTGFARDGFSPDPNISPNNQVFGAAVIAVVSRAGITGGTSTANYQPLFQRGASFSAGSGAIVVPTNNVAVYIPEDCIIQNVEVLTAGGTGSCVLDIWKVPYASYPPTVANSITASAKPTISSGVTYLDSTLTGWTTALSAGDTLLINLTSCSTFTYVMLVLTMKTVGSILADGYTDARAIAVTVGSSSSPLSGTLGIYVNGTATPATVTIDGSPGGVGGLRIGSIATPKVSGTGNSAQWAFWNVVDGTNAPGNGQTQGFISMNRYAGTKAVNYGFECGNDTTGHECVLFDTSTAYTGTTVDSGPSGEQKGVTSIDGTPLVLAVGARAGLWMDGTNVYGRGPQAGTAVAITADRDTFQGTVTGVSNSVTGTITCRRNGQFAMLYTPSAMIGTSNANTLVLSGIPAAWQPAVDGLVPCSNLEDNGVNVAGVIRLSPSTAGGTCFVSAVTGTRVSQLSNGFTASGQKGFNLSVIGPYAIA